MPLDTPPIHLSRPRTIPWLRIQGKKSVGWPGAFAPAYWFG
jgi:hypothetical protein